MQGAFALKGGRVGSDGVYVVRVSRQDSAVAGADESVSDGSRASANGGFPEPPPGCAVRVVTAEHDGCGHATRVRLPGHLPAVVVRRVVCRGCAETYDAPRVNEVELLEPEPDAPGRQPAAPAAPLAAAATLAPPSPARPRLRDRLRSLPWLRDPGSRFWRLASIPLAAAAVIGALLLIQGGGDDSSTPFAGAPTAAPAEEAEDGAAGASAGGNARLVRESSFSLALPPGWERTGAPGGATFAAASEDGGADATLWVERDAGLSFGEFEVRSLEQLESLAGSSSVVERLAAPTPEGTVVRLAADAPEGSPAYEVTLRAAGPYRYYLATTVQPAAPRAAAKGAELVHGSFVPRDTGASRGGGD